MRLVVLDYVGHPFQAQLARALAHRGHDVLHLHCASFVTGKGRVARAPGDPASLEFAAVDLGGEFARYDVVRRLGHELRAGRELVGQLERFRPDVVISSNTPLVVQARVVRWCARRRAGFVFWQQDVISAAARRVLGRRLPILGAAAEAMIAPLERSLLRRSDAVVVISEDFVPLLRRWGVPESRVTVIENWAPLDELPVLPRENAWAREQELADRTVFLYSGTLGFKHDPSLLLELARWAAGRGALVVVVSEGQGADWLAEQGAAEPALRLLPYQPYERLPEVLASADVLLALLDPAAAGFSVPSKVLTYLCAGRPLLVSVGPDNLAARVVDRSGGGVVVPAADGAALVAAAEELLGNDELRSELGGRARAYAETTFDADAIAARFEEVLRLRGAPAA
ncbi:MAG: glycosyltransferase family 4 protein [Gaiellaceae bacterium]